MQPLPPPPPYIPLQFKQNKPSAYHQIVLPKNNQSSTSPILGNPNKLRLRDQQPILRAPRKTNPVIWCGAILCLVFSILLIFFGIATLIVFVSIKPKYPVFDTPAAALPVVLFNSPTYLNADLTFLANFSNPNKKLNVRYEHVFFELYFSESLIATQMVQPFGLIPGEARWISVHMLSSLVYLPPYVALELQKQEQRNRVVYNIKGSFKVRIKLGIVHYYYWLHVRCQLEMTSPPTGSLITHSCRTKRNK